MRIRRMTSRPESLSRFIPVAIFELVATLPFSAASSAVQSEL